MTVMVPTMIAMLLAHPDFEPERMRSLEVLTYGASPMPVALLARLLELFPDLEVYQGYGMTESSAVLTALGPTTTAPAVTCCAPPAGRSPGSC
jgi:acyl-CoA synthetase (AMP-forming)/AMP-acid ligase II